ncbi:MAG: UDP-N-acetylmuramoylalanine--D-glutamate ligase [Frankiaceae bacterium]|nr:UDP-N-acetylmuramoylalanine--D-glutamate ligase [Frankiaceae bacterium]
MTPPDWLAGADRDSPWPTLTVTVAGTGVSGASAVRALRSLGATVTAVDAAVDDAARARAADLQALGATVVLGQAASITLPPGTQLIVTSPGWRPDAPLLANAAAAGIPVWGDVELAWRLRAQGAAPWLAITGTNGKTTTVGMLAAILEADGRRAAAVGNVGAPILDAVLAADPYDVLAVELSSFQLHWAPSVAPLAGAVLNIAPDHLDWHGSFEAYAEDKAAIWRGNAVAIGNADDSATAGRLARVDGRRVTFTLAEPAAGQLGVRGGWLVDRAFSEAPRRLATATRLRPAGAHNVGNALAAAGLALSAGVGTDAVAAGLANYRPDGHRNELVLRRDDVAWVDDSKATNPHAAAASLASYDSIVWIAGGLNKGLDFDELVRLAAPRLRAAVLLGECRRHIAEALARHAPDVPVVDVGSTETTAMVAVVQEAAALARRGDTVLLAPAAASMDMFRDYKHRGDVFAEAVRALAGRG